MDIAWIGHAAFRLRGRDAAVVMDPAPSSTGFRLGRPQADLVTVSNDAPEHSWIGGVAGEPLELIGPGEYEVKDVLATGVLTAGPPGNGEARRNLAFVVTIDDIVVAHLGDMGAPPSGDALEELNRADVLLLPVGGNGHMDVETATKIMGLLEARLVIPMLYKAGSESGKLDSIDGFLNATGATLPAETENHINLSRRDLPQNTTILVLSPRGETD